MKTKIFVIQYEAGDDYEAHYDVIEDIVKGPAKANMTALHGKWLAHMDVVRERERKAWKAIPKSQRKGKVMHPNKPWFADYLVQEHGFSKTEFSLFTRA